MDRFECKLCDFVQDYENAPFRCPKCNSGNYTLRFLKNSKEKHEFVNVGYQENWRYSRALGVPEEQIAEASKVYPHTEWKKFGHHYRPLIKNRAEKKRIMKAFKMEEYNPKDFKGKN